MNTRPTFIVDTGLRFPAGIFAIGDGVGARRQADRAGVPHSDAPKAGGKPLSPEHDGYERPTKEVRVVGRAVWVSRRL